MFFFFEEIRDWLRICISLKCFIPANYWVYLSEQMIDFVNYIFDAFIE